MSKANRQNWSCVKCKSDPNAIYQHLGHTSQKKNLVVNTSSADYNLKDLTDSVNFRCNNFDNFGVQIEDVLAALKEMREENKVLKEQNI